MPDVFLLPVFVGHKCPTYDCYGCVSRRPANGANRVRGLRHTPYVNGKRPSEKRVLFFRRPFAV